MAWLRKIMSALVLLKSFIGITVIIVEDGDSHQL